MEDIILTFLNRIKNLEKYIIPVIVSFIAVVITLFLFDIENIFLVKVGKTVFMLFFFCIYFILIEMILWLKEKCKEKCKEKQRRDRLEKQQLEDLWNFVDSLNQKDCAYLKELIENNNKTIFINDREFHKSKLLKSNFVHKTVIKASEEYSYSSKPAIIGYMLTDKTFRLFKISQNKYNRISHFNY